MYICCKKVFKEIAETKVRIGYKENLSMSGYLAIICKLYKKKR